MEDMEDMEAMVDTEEVMEDMEEGKSQIIPNYVCLIIPNYLWTHLLILIVHL